jgi:hypothetical protein
MKAMLTGAMLALTITTAEEDYSADAIKRYPQILSYVCRS